MGNGFPSLSDDQKTQLAAAAPREATPAPSVHVVLTSPAPSRARGRRLLWGALGLALVATALISTRPGKKARPSEATLQSNTEDATTGTAVVDAVPGKARAALRTAATRPPTEAEPEPTLSGFRADVPRVPEPYTGDPEGQALWERTVEEDQATPQPEDLEPEPKVERLDLRKLPGYADQNIDADGNVN